MLEPRRVETAIQGDLLDLPNFNDDDTDVAEEEAPAAKRPWWRQPRWIAIVSGVLIVVLLLTVPMIVRAFNGPRVTYTTAQVTQGDLAVTVSATGPVQSSIYNVNFSGSGKLTEIDVNLGQQVTAGQTLAKLDKTSLQDALNQAQAQVNSAQISLNNAYNNRSSVQTQTQAQINAAYAQEQQTISKCAGDTNCINAAQAQYNSTVAQANAQRASAQAQISSAQAQLQSAQTQLQTAQHNLANATLTAPHAGVIAAINGTVGGTPGASSSSASSGSSGSSGSGGSGSGGTFIQIADLSSLQVLANINEADIGSVALNQPVRFTVSAYSNRRFSGTVSAISPLGQSSSNVVTYPVTINVDPQSLQGAALLPNMTANVTITTAQHTGTLLIPTSAITFARQSLTSNSGLVTRQEVLAALQQARQMANSLPTSGSAGAGSNTSAPTPAFVLERSSDGKWTVKPVVLGLTNGTAYEVLAGLSAGETVVTGQQGGTTTSTSTTGGAGGIFGGGRGAGGGFGGGGAGGGRGGAGGGGNGGQGGGNGG